MVNGSSFYVVKSGSVILQCWKTVSVKASLPGGCRLTKKKCAECLILAIRQKHQAWKERYLVWVGRLLRNLQRRLRNRVIWALTQVSNLQHHVFCSLFDQPEIKAERHYGNNFYFIHLWVPWIDEYIVFVTTKCGRRNNKYERRAALNPCTADFRKEVRSRSVWPV